MHQKFVKHRIFKLTVLLMWLMGGVMIVGGNMDVEASEGEASEGVNMYTNQDVNMKFDLIRQATDDPVVTWRRENKTGVYYHIIGIDNNANLGVDSNLQKIGKILDIRLEKFDPNSQYSQKNKVDLLWLVFHSHNVVSEFHQLPEHIKEHAIFGHGKEHKALDRSKISKRFFDSLQAYEKFLSDGNIVPF